MVGNDVNDNHNFTFNLIYSPNDDLIEHNPTHHPMQTNPPSYISKLQGNVGEDTYNPIMLFHLWCSLNNIVHGIIRIHLFQCTIMRVDVNGT